MNPKRGEIWLAQLDPTRGSEQDGTRPVVVFQNELISKYSTTVLAISFTTNLRRAALPSCVLVNKDDGGLIADSVALCHQLRVLDKSRLIQSLGILQQDTLFKIEECVLFTTGIS